MWRPAHCFSGHTCFSPVEIHSTHTKDAYLHISDMHTKVEEKDSWGEPFSQTYRYTPFTLEVICNKSTCVWTAYVKIYFTRVLITTFGHQSWSARVYLCVSLCIHVYFTKNFVKPRRIPHKCVWASKAHICEVCVYIQQSRCCPRSILCLCRYLCRYQFV